MYTTCSTCIPPVNHMFITHICYYDVVILNCKCFFANCVTNTLKTCAAIWCRSGSLKPDRPQCSFFGCSVGLMSDAVFAAVTDLSEIGPQLYFAYRSQFHTHIFFGIVWLFFCQKGPKWRTWRRLLHNAVQRRKQFFDHPNSVENIPKACCQARVQVRQRAATKVANLLFFSKNRFSKDLVSSIKTWWQTKQKIVVFFEWTAARQNSTFASDLLPRWLVCCSSVTANDCFYVGQFAGGQRSQENCHEGLWSFFRFLLLNTDKFCAWQVKKTVTTKLTSQLAGHAISLRQM